MHKLLIIISMVFVILVALIFFAGRGIEKVMAPQHVRLQLSMYEVIKEVPFKDPHFSTPMKIIYYRERHPR